MVALRRRAPRHRRTRIAGTSADRYGSDSSSYDDDDDSDASGSYSPPPLPSSDEEEDDASSVAPPYAWLTSQRRVEIHRSRCKRGCPTLWRLVRALLRCALLLGALVLVVLGARRALRAATVDDAVDDVSSGESGVIDPAAWDAFAASFSRDDTEKWYMRTYAENRRLFHLIAVGRATLFVQQIHNSGSDLISHVFGMHAYDPEPRQRELRRSAPACKAMADCSNWTRTFDTGLALKTWECRDRKWLLRVGHNNMDNLAFRLWNASARSARRVLGPGERPKYECVPAVHSFGFQQFAKRSTWLPNERAALTSYFANARLVRGSYVFGLHELGHRGIDYAYATALRNPLGRTMAQWNRWTTVEELKIVRDSYFDTWLYGEMTFKHKRGWPPRWNHKTFGYYMLANHMTRVLCGRPMLRPYPDGSIPREDEITSKDQLLPLTRRELEDAKRNLVNDYALVLIVDMIDAPLAEELQRLCVALFSDVERDVLAKQSRTHRIAAYFESIDHVPVGPANQIHARDLTPTLRRRILRLNTLDLELYEFGQRLFAKQLGILRHMYNEKVVRAKVEDVLLGHKRPPKIVRDPLEWI